MGMQNPDRPYSFIDNTGTRSREFFTKVVDARRALKAAGHGGRVVRMVAGNWETVGNEIERTRAPLRWYSEYQSPRPADGSIYGVFSGIGGEEMPYLSAYVHPDGVVVFDMLPQRYDEYELRKEVAPLVPKILKQGAPASDRSPQRTLVLGRAKR